jgi:Flp pilus assembly protein TadD
MSNLGYLFAAQGRQSKARTLCQQALTIREQTLGSEHPQTVQSLNDLAMLLHAMGDLKGAHTYMSRELVIRQQVQGARHPGTALCHNDLGMLLCQMGDLDLAQQHFEQALAIMDQVSGGVLQHHTAQILKNLAMSFWQNDDLKNARFYLRRALTTYQLTLGKDHPEAKAARLDLERLNMHDKGA